MIVGITGGIGSGKTTVAAVFHHLGIPVFHADDVSRNIIDEDPQVQQNLVQVLGEKVLVNGKIDRPYMASVIFNEVEILQDVTSIIHPAVARHFREWHLRHSEAPYVMREAAILFESGSYHDCDKIVVVTAPSEMRIERVVQRNGVTREQVVERMNHQWPEEQKLARADYVVRNDYTESVLKQVLAIHEDLLRQSDQGS